MKLLILTQVVDTEDPILGFFHRWIEEFAKHAESIIVVCLREGVHDLPENVKVLSLGKESGVSRLKYVYNFYRYIIRERKNYDSVFVHMNQVYVILGGLLWRMWGKRIGLWYTHGHIPFSLRLATALAEIVFTASKVSFRLPSQKVHVMGHGIDTDFFSPSDTISRGSHWLSVGRLMSTKHHDEAIRFAHEAGHTLRIAGDGPERVSLERLVQELGAEVEFLGPLTQTELRTEYQMADTLIHRSHTGSLDKVVLEAAASGCRVDSTDPAIAPLPLSVTYVREEHSLPSLITRILYIYEKYTTSA